MPAFLDWPLVWPTTPSSLSSSESESDGGIMPAVADCAPRPRLLLPPPSVRLSCAEKDRGKKDEEMWGGVRESSRWLGKEDREEATFGSSGGARDSWHQSVLPHLPRFRQAD